MFGSEDTICAYRTNQQTSKTGKANSPEYRSHVRYPSGPVLVRFTVKTPDGLHDLGDVRSVSGEMRPAIGKHCKVQFQAALPGLAHSHSLSLLEPSPEGAHAGRAQLIVGRLHQTSCLVQSLHAVDPAQDPQPLPANPRCYLDS